MEYEEGIIVRNCIVNSQSTFQGTVRVMKSYTYYSRLSNYINNIEYTLYIYKNTFDCLCKRLLIL